MRLLYSGLVALEIQLFQMPYIESDLICRKLRADRTTTIAMGAVNHVNHAGDLEPKPTQKTYNDVSLASKLPQIIYYILYILYYILYITYYILDIIH